MAYTTITASIIGLADGDASPTLVDGTVRITPRFPSIATASGFTVSGPVVVAVTGGDMPKTQVPSMDGATGLVEFHLYDRNTGPVKMPSTEIPLDPDTTISLNEYLPVGVDPVSGAVFIKGETGPQGPRGERGPQGPEGPKGDTGDRGPEGTQGPTGETGDTGPEGPEGPQGPRGEPGEDGKDGSGVEIKGDLDSTDDLPSSGSAGDAYMIAGEMHIWDVLDSMWVNVGPIRGPQGPPGEDGIIGADGADGIDGEQGPKGDPGEDGAPAPRADLIGNLEAPVVIAHRGGGALVYPEQGLRGIIAATEAGFLPEVDVQFLSDGTPVLCHDNTVDRTMTGASGLVKDLSLDQWRQLRINPVFEGGRDDRPLTLADTLDYMGGRIVLVAEVKQGATTSEVDRVIGMVKDRGLEKSVLMQSFDFDAATQMAAAGLEVVILCGKTSTQTWSEIKSEGINYLGPSRSMTASDMNAASAAGLRVVPYVTEKRSQVTDFPASVFGYFSNDPWQDSDRMPQWSAPGWSTGDGWPGRIVQSPSAGEIVDYPAQISGGNLALPEYRDADGSSTYYLIHVGLTHMTGGPIEAPFRMYGKILYDRGHSTQSSNCGFTLYRNDVDPEAPFEDGAVEGQQGLTFAARRNGDMQGWGYQNGASATSIMKATYAGDVDPAPSGESRIMEVLLEVDVSGMTRWTNLTTGVTAEVQDAPTGGLWTPMIRSATQGLTVLDVAVWRSPTSLPPMAV